MKGNSTNDSRTVLLLRAALILLLVSVIGNLFFLNGYLKEARRFAPATSVVHKQFNFHIVSPGFWRSAKPNEESVKRMKSYGLKTIINLRRESKLSEWEKALAGRYGLHYYHFPMDSRVKQDSRMLEEILTILENPENQPVLVHCAAGKDRTGLVSALYRLKFTDWKFEDIHREMLMYGYDEKSFPLIIETVREWHQGSQALSSGTKG